MNTISSHIAPSFSIPIAYHQRHNGHVAQSLFEHLQSIPRTIGLFVLHRYADCRMFVRALSSMFGTTTLTDIDRRVYQIFQYRRVVEEPTTDPQALRVPLALRLQTYTLDNLSPDTFGLFFYVDRDFVAEFSAETNPIRIEKLRQEILRECDRAICLQRTLSSVNIFVNAVKARWNNSPVPTPQPTRHGRNNSPQEATLSRAPVAQPVPAGVNVEIPQTIAYVKDAVPNDVQQKAAEIERLKGIFESRRGMPSAPSEFNDSLNLAGIMSLPVFDASHPDVQNNLDALNTAITNSDAAQLRRFRNNRHTMEKESLEGYYGSRNYETAVRCPMCRHSERYGIRRSCLRIDLKLQDDILQFLRTATGN